MECPRKITINKTAQQFPVSSTLVLCHVGITHFEDVLRFELLQVKPGWVELSNDQLNDGVCRRNILTGHYCTSVLLTVIPWMIPPSVYQK